MSYEKLCDQVTILKSPQDGDSFFKAVADGINIYNYENQDSKIIRANYGKTELFTTAVLRELVLRYLEGLGDEIINIMLSVAEKQVDILNAKFEASINGLQAVSADEMINSEQYINEINNIYNGNNNFLIYKPERVPIEVQKYFSPFRVLQKREIPNYIRSKNYWANYVAIETICSILNICVIPIEKYDYERTSGTVRLKTNMVDRLKALLKNKILVNNKCSNMVMFLLYQNNHYELIRFTYMVKPAIKLLGQGIRQQTEYNKKWYTIFKTKDLAPPFHILILIYGTLYSASDNFPLDDFSKYINSSIIKLRSSPIWLDFKQKFDDIFPNTQSIEERINFNGAEPETQSITQQPQQEYSMVTRNSEDIDMDGGQQPSNRPYYRPPYGYSRPNYITKKPDEQESSKISYSITIDMELHPGTSLTPEQLSQSKCNSRYNAIRKAYSEFTGKPYVIPPVYTEPKNNTKKMLIQTKGGNRRTHKHRK